MGPGGNKHEAVNAVGLHVYGLYEPLAHRW